MLAKARRLARFSVELSQPIETLQNAKHQTPESKLNRASLDKMETDKVTEATSLSIRDNFSEMGSLEFSSAVVGLCQDMCPGILNVYASLLVILDFLGYVQSLFL